MLNRARLACLIVLAASALCRAQVGGPIVITSDLPKTPPSQTAPADTQPVAKGTEAKFVADTLATIDANRPDTAAAARKALIDKGDSLVPALQAALPNAAGPARAVVAEALVSLAWKLDPPKLIKDWAVKKNGNFKADLNPGIVTDESLDRLFPAVRFWLVAFRTFPVAMEPPEPLDSRNIFTVTKDGAVDLIKAQDALKKFFSDKLPPVKEERDAKDAVIAWLEISKEFTNDGMMRFTIPADQVKVTKTDKGWEATGVATLGGGPIAGGPPGPGGPNARAIMGDRGQITVTMTFDDKGKFKDAVEDVKIQRGMRPICQATKLLDTDPIVRKMARQDLLMMGPAARQYLMEQRENASPQLKAEIDKVWREILDREEQWEQWSKGK